MLELANTGLLNQIFHRILLNHGLEDFLSLFDLVDAEKFAQISYL